MLFHSLKTKNKVNISPLIARRQILFQFVDSLYLRKYYNK